MRHNQAPFVIYKHRTIQHIRNIYLNKQYFSKSSNLYFLILRSSQNHLFNWVYIHCFNSQLVAIVCFISNRNHVVIFIKFKYIEITLLR